MRATSFVILLAAAVVAAASGCKKQSTSEAEQATSQPTTSEPAVGAAGTQGGPAPEAPEQPSEAGESPAPAEGARPTPTLVNVDGRTRVTVDTPRGVKVSFAVPAEWVQSPRPNRDTLVVMGAPAATATPGVKATVVAKDFDGDQKALVESTRTRLQSFVPIKGESSVKIGSIDAHEFSASWSTPMGNRETRQRIVATGEEVIGVTCQVPPAVMDSIGSLCDDIFASLSLDGIPSK